MQRFFRQLIFNLWYFRKPPWDTNITPPEVAAFIATHPAGRALDLGCGTGTNAIGLAQKGWQVTGVDFALKAIHSARRKAQEAGVQVDLRVGDVTRLEHISGPFDLVLDMGCFHGLTPAGKAAYAANLPGLLTPGGTFLLYAMLKEPGAGGSGMQPSELELLTQRLHLVERQDGSERGWRPSAWFRFGC